VILHHGGASERVRADKMVRLLRAKMGLIDLHLPGWQRAIARRLFGAWPRSRLLAHRVLGRLRRGRGDGAQVWAEVVARRAEWERGLG
jgi:hypothetical protein